jgi:LmbE family N-acetylglucosaminyl deacetylase
VTDPLKLLIIGAHPDDAEFHAGALAVLYRRHGHQVRMVSLTNGEAGHQTLRGAELVAIRRREAAAAATLIGAESAVWDYPDGQLEPSLALRWDVIREIRRYAPDLVLTHRTCDYHPDHRATAHAVRDACYLVTVPAIVPDAPALARDPVVMHLPDRFTKPAPLAADMVVDATDAFDAVVDLLACHQSQVFEWLPYNQGTLHEVPAAPADRRSWLAAWYGPWLRPMADRYRAALVERHGVERAGRIEYAEVFEASEYAAPLDAAARQRLFGFLT